MVPVLLRRRDIDRPAFSVLAAALGVKPTVSRPREMCALISSRTRGSSSSNALGSESEISACFRLTELSSTAICRPSNVAVPRP